MVKKDLKMSYHTRFPSLRKMLQGDLSKKLIKCVKLMDFKVRECNCRGVGKCQYGSVCRVPTIIYKITCKMTNKIYIGKTQQYFKM
jgi:hypothetical protein